MPTDRRIVNDPRAQRDAAHDQDKHGRKQNSGTNQPTKRGAGSSRDADRDRQPHRPSDSSGKS
jgi:hypothetical protein